MLEFRAIVRAGIAVVWLVFCFPSLALGNSRVVERAVCGWKEPLIFWAWRHAAGKPSRIPSNAGITEVTFTTHDGRRLVGYRIASSLGAGADRARGAVLFAQGNAMLASQVVEELSSFARAGLDVFVYDYRGYGLSQGKSRLLALISDYHELALALKTEGYKNLYLYGVSLGGAIITDAAVGVPFTRMALDSVPSRLSEYGCPKGLDPVAELPRDASRILILAGTADRIVPLARSAELRNAIVKKGGRERVGKGWGHPFQDSSEDERLEIVARYFGDESVTK